MPILWLIFVVLAIAAAGYVLARSRALSDANGSLRALHSLPSYYGLNAALKIVVPGFGLMILWLLIQPLIIDSALTGMLPEGTSRGLALSEVHRAADGIEQAMASGALTTDPAATDPEELTERLKEAGAIITSTLTRPIVLAAERLRALEATGRLLMTVSVVLAALAGLVVSLRETRASYRARNVVEQGILAILIGAASLAILTTVGIVLSLIFNTVEFFRLYPAWDFFFGHEWAPSFSGRGGSSALGVLPLLWGTLYISIVALLVAVPVGLFSAVYLSEYASSRARAIAKPMLEILAGIPTIVYGLFALLTVGPLLVSVFGDGGALGVDWQGGGRAVMTAGLVMGIMLIPFVSSLSDDIINAVPQSMRDGSYGLGATKSETIKQVILPAALPGIVGAPVLRL